jgi:hypothetical protein
MSHLNKKSPKKQISPAPVVSEKQMIRKKYIYFVIKDNKKKGSIHIVAKETVGTRLPVGAYGPCTICNH